MNVRNILRLEGAAVFAGATYAFVTLDGTWWMYLVLILAPDIGMLGYLAGPTMGARTYNAVHTYALPLLLAGFGWWRVAPMAILVALVWMAHIGIDRAMGFGFKYQTGFKDTHLDRLRVSLATP